MWRFLVTTLIIYIYSGSFLLLAVIKSLFKVLVSLHDISRTEHENLYKKGKHSLAILRS